MAINKALNIGVKRAHKQGDWLGFDAVEVYPKTTDKALSERIDKLLLLEGAKINESINNDTMDDQINKLTIWRDGEKAKFEATKAGKNAGKPSQVANYNEQVAQYNALNMIVNAMKKERKLRDAVDAQIASAQTIDTLEEWNKIKNIWRSTEQKKTILDNIRRVEAAIKASEEAAKVEAAKQAKLNELNNKLATSTDPNEKKAIAAQIGALMGSVSTETGLPKGALYIGIGVAVVVGIWITLRAIRK
jgi:hypothetical protein